MIQDITDSDNTQYLLVDSGNFLFNTTRLSSNREKDKINAAGISRIYQAMKYDAVNIGPYDLAAGISTVRQMNNLPWVSANIYDQSGQSVFKPYVIKKTEIGNIGIIGLSQQPANLENTYNYKSWQLVLPEILNTLQDRVSCIIVLSSLLQHENREIARKFPSIRIIFTSLPSSGNKPPYLENQAIITQTGNRGRYLGQLYLTNPGINQWKPNLSSTQYKQIERKLKTIEFNIDRQKKIIQAKEVDSKKRAFAKKQREVLVQQKESLEQQLKNPSGPTGSMYKAAFIPLTKNISGDNDIELIIQETSQKQSAPGK